MKISVVINLDSREGVEGQSTSFTHHNMGCRSWGFFGAGIENKRKFFEGFDIEVIVYIDETVTIPDGILRQVRDLADCVVIRKHFTTYRGVDQCGWANDIRYLSALSQATGDLVVHFDADTAAFARDKATVDRLLELTERFRFVSYPSQWSPRPVDDASFGKHTWASTRFFACHRDWLKFDTLERALRLPEWAYEQYGQPLRRCMWLEHFLALVNEESVIYPPRDDNNLLIFCWDHYISGVMEKLNLRTYDEVLAYVTMCGGVHYPNDCTALNP